MKLVIIVTLFFPSLAYHIFSPISNYLIEAQRKESISYSDDDDDLRKHLQSVVQEAFLDALHPDQNLTDQYNESVAESEQRILLLGERVNGRQVSQFCGYLANQQLYHTPIVLRDAIEFLPVRPVPIPVTNLTISIPSRWFREFSTSYPTIFVCYEGDTFLKILRIPSKRSNFDEDGKFHKLVVENPYNKRCRMRGILLVLDDHWNNRHLLPRNLEARAYIESNGPVKRATYTDECTPRLGLNQDCCLWKFEFHHLGEKYQFHRCFGQIPIEALKSTVIPEQLATLLVNGEMSRRFLAPPSKVCREIEYEQMTVRKTEHELITLNRLNATKCAIFF